MLKAPQNAPAPSAPSRDMDRNAFMRLLVTQLSNQDPLNPQGGHEFAAQLAQFTSVEQLTQIGDSLATQARILASMAGGLSEAGARQDAANTHLSQRAELTLASGLIGREVELSGRHLPWDGASPASFAFTLAGPAADVRVTVRNEAGQPVRTLSLGHAGRGPGMGTWDGRGHDGQPLPAGSYTFELAAIGGEGEPVSATAFSRGRVDRVSVEGGAVTLWVGGRAVPLNDLRGLA